METINERAKASWKESFPIAIGDQYKRWEAHWIATAKAWRDELQAEGLVETVKGLNKVIEFFEKQT